MCEGNETSIVMDLEVTNSSSRNEYIGIQREFKKKWWERTPISQQNSSIRLLWLA
jgi:hypothetical protein